jgi:hypothetical protein
MLQRCFDVHSEKYPSYGGRGITVCQEWVSNYSAFRAALGRRPSSEFSLGRINNEGNYEPGNVHWETRKQQARNTRTSRFIAAFGETVTVAEWAERFSIKPRLITKRLALGWEPEKALTRPTETLEQRRQRAKIQAANAGNRIGINGK